MKYVLFGLAALALSVGAMGLSADTTLAYRGDPAVQGPSYSTERHEAMERAFESGDYNAWKTLMQGRGRVSQVITQENFAQFAEAHRLAQQGDTVGAQKIRESLGLGLHNGLGRGAGRGTCRQ